MDGLTNIIAKIHEQNAKECENLLNEARQEAKGIIDTAKLEAKEAVSKIKAATDNEIAVACSRADSASEIEYKRVILAKKSELLEGAVNCALESIKNSPDDVYFTHIEKLIVSNALCGKGVVRMSERDISRLATGFEEKINSLLTDGKTIEISKEPSLIDGGFVIEYPEIRVDCTFASLIADKMDEIRDELSKVLFA